MKNILTIILLLFTLSAVSQTTYYVAASGGDNGDNGDPANPWATLGYAVTQVSAGDTIYMQAGTHTINTQVTIPVSISLTGAGETSIITSTSFGTEGQYVINMTSSSLSNGNQTISYLKFDGNNLAVAQCFYILKRHNVKIHHCTFVNWKYQAIIWSGDGTGNIGSDPYANVTYPTAYVTGSEFYNNTMTSCSVYDSYGHGALCIGGQQGMLIHDNVINNASRPSGTPGYCIKTQYPGFIRGAKIYNNTLTTAVNEWKFAIEGFFFYGVEIYDNTIIGAIDINFISKSDYDYGTWIHDNTLGPASAVSGYRAMIFEFNTSDVIVERNDIRYCSDPILFTPRTNNTVENYRFSYNIIRNIPSGGYAVSGGTASATIYFDNIQFYNNIFSGAPLWGFSLFGTWNKFYFKNNIFTASTWYWMGFRQNAADSVYVMNNILYNNAQSNGIYFEAEATNYTNSGNITTNPNFVGGSPYDFKLQSNSPGKDAGLDVGLTTDYINYAVPYNLIVDIGAYEYGSSPATPSDETDILTFVFSEQTAAATINSTTHTVSIEVEVGTDISELTPTITVSSGATIVPASGVEEDFSSPVTYTVTAEDEETDQEWTVTVTIEEEEDIILVTSIDIWNSSGVRQKIDVNGGSVTFSYSAYPAEATDKTVTWTKIEGTGTGIFTLGAPPTLTAVTNGTVTIRATANDGSGVYYEIVMTLSNQREDFIKRGNKIIKYGNIFIK
jgi:hypothetical protein